jgi:putative tricarboxylic transport membrane protein
MNTNTELIRERIASTALIGFSIAIWVIADGLPEMPDGSPGPGLFPLIIAAGLGLSGFMLGIQSFFSTPEEMDSPKGDVRGLGRLGGGIILAFFAPFLAPYIGFVPVVGLVVLGLGILMKVPIKWALVGSVSASLLIYAIFVGLLGVSL